MRVGAGASACAAALEPDVRLSKGLSCARTDADGVASPVRKAGHVSLTRLAIGIKAKACRPRI